MKKILFVLVLILFATEESSGKFLSRKGRIHVFTAPLITVSGIYSSSQVLRNTDHAPTRAAAITDLVLLGFQSSGGLTVLIGDEDFAQVVRKVHRIIGIGVIASGLWLSVANTVDDNVPRSARIAAYGQTVMAIGPQLLFSF
jgi:hypothetical protein